MGILQDRIIEEIKLRNFSPVTQQSYVYAVSPLAQYHKKSPAILIGSRDTNK